LCAVNQAHFRIGVQQAGYARLVFVCMSRFHSFSSMKEVQAELSPFMSSVAPARAQAKIPFITVDNSIGQRSIVATARSELSGDIVVEDVPAPADDDGDDSEDGKDSKDSKAADTKAAKGKDSKEAKDAKAAKDQAASSAAPAKKPAEKAAAGLVRRLVFLATGYASPWIIRPSDALYVSSRAHAG
jgi:hypothetical protein